MQFHEIDLEAFELGLNDKDLSKRTQIKVCGTGINVTFERCMSILAFGSSIALGTAGILYVHSENRVCYPEEFHDPDYQYAVMTKGNCHTTAQRSTIQGAIDHYIDKEMPKSTCGVQCMKLTHGGNWEGYVVFGAGTYDWEHYLDMCASISKLGQCESGGKKYIHN